MKALFAEGPTGSVYYDGQTITVTRTGLWSALTSMRGKQSIAVTDVGEVRLVPARLTQGQGFIQFLRADDPVAHLRHRSYGRKDSYADASLDPLSCRFKRKQQAAFEEIAHAVATAIGSTPVVVTDEDDDEPKDATSPLDFTSQEARGTDVTEQIRRLAALREEGILTEEEFSAKKAELLSRM